MAKRTSLAARRTRPKAVRQRIRNYAASAYREEILDAAERVFLEAGYHDAKMIDLAQAAGVSIGTLYNYFDSKERVFASLVERGREEFFAELEQAAAEGGPRERLTAIVRAALAYAERRGALFALYLQIGALTETDIRRAGGPAAEDGYLEYLSLVRDALKDAVDAGVVRSDLDLDLLSGGLAGAVNLQVFHWVRGGRKAALAAVAETLVALFLDGARAQ